MSEVWQEIKCWLGFHLATWFVPKRGATRNTVKCRACEKELSSKKVTISEFMKDEWK